jgi:hypothetical protein
MDDQFRQEMLSALQQVVQKLEGEMRSEITQGIKPVLDKLMEVDQRQSVIETVLRLPAPATNMPFPAYDKSQQSQAGPGNPGSAPQMANVA